MVIQSWEHPGLVGILNELKLIFNLVPDSDMIRNLWDEEAGMLWTNQKKKLIIIFKGTAW